MSDIVERLRFRADENYEMLGNIHEPLLEAADEIERLRAALRDIIDKEVYGFEIESNIGTKIFVEGNSRFSLEEDVVAVRKIARAALEGK